MRSLLVFFRSEHIQYLVYPLNTVLDDSIGCAVWFAARGQGVMGNGPDKGKPVVSTSRVGYTVYSKVPL